MTKTILEMHRRTCRRKGEVQGHWRRSGHRLRGTHSQGISWIFPLPFSLPVRPPAHLYTLFMYRYILFYT